MLIIHPQELYFLIMLIQNKKFIRRGLQIQQLQQLEHFCIKYQLLINIGVKYINPLMIPYLDFSRNSSKYFNFGKLIKCLFELTLFLNTLLSNKKKLKFMIISLLSEELVRFLIIFALKNGFYYSLG